MTKKILMVLTSNGKWYNTNFPTGFWYEEFSTPYYKFLDSGCELDLASPQGGLAPHDPMSINDENRKDSVDRFMASAGDKAKLENTQKLAEIDFNNYDAIFIPGGYGLMFDLAMDQEILPSKIKTAYEAGKIFAAVCHGPAALTNVTLTDGSALVKGKKVTCYSNSEEEDTGVVDKVPFLTESKLKELGGVYSAADIYQEHVVQDGQLITGQNPASSEKIADLVLAAL